MLTPLVLRRVRLVLVVLLPLDALMLCATITEGAHYACDTLAGAAVGIAAFLLAKRLESTGARGLALVHHAMPSPA